MDEDIENRFSHRHLRGERVEKREEIEAKAKELAHLIHGACPTSRERALSMTKLQECVMWANASMACN